MMSSLVATTVAAASATMDRANVCIWFAHTKNSPKIPAITATLRLTTMARRLCSKSQSAWLLSRIFSHILRTSATAGIHSRV